LSGTLTLRNHRETAIRLEVHRVLLGTIDEVSAGGKVEQANIFDPDQPWASEVFDRNAYWHWNNAYRWWHQLNGLGRATWELELKPGEKAELTYAWHYFWS